MGKVRPGIVVSGTAHNEVLNTLVVIPTSTVAPEILPLRMSVGSIGGKESYAVIPGIRQVSHEHLLALDDCLEAYLH
jgi:hypothetical protein